MARLRRRWRVSRWRIAFCMACCAYLASVLVHATLYSQRVTATVQCGFIGLYWGGPSDVRNGWVHNWFSGPWNGNGGGTDAPEGVEFWVRGLDDFRTTNAIDWRYMLGGFLPRCGTNPHLSRKYTFHELVAPCWMPLAVLTSVVVYRFRFDRRRIPPHCCQSCGYDLTGNTSGTCPECGHPVANDTTDR